MRSLEVRSAELDRSFETLDAAFDRRRAELRATPHGLPVEGWFSHGYGWRKDPFNERRTFHRGIDIVAHSGTPIVAPADGVVSRSLRVADYGKMIDLECCSN